MADQLYTLSGATIAISGTTQNDDLDQSGFEGLSYTDVSNVGSIGSYGNDTNMVSYDTLDRKVTQKQKGITNAGDPEIEVARVDSDAGQTAMVAAGAVDSRDSYAFKVTKQDGSVDYLRGLVSGPVDQGGRNEDFDLQIFTLGLVQEPLHVDASA